MMSFEEALNLHTCLSFLENKDKSNIDGQIISDGIEIYFDEDDEGLINLIEVKVNDKSSPTLKKLIQEYLKENEI